MSTQPPDSCPSCGAALAVGAGGQCPQCHAQIGGAAPADEQHAHAGKKSRHANETGLVPLHLNFGAVAPVIFRTMFLLNMISDENSVQQYTRTHPDAHHAILALSRAVAQAGQRAREDNPKVNVIRQDSRVFTAQEIWMVDLAIDVLAMFAGGGGLKSETSGMVQWRMKELDEHVHSHHWQREVRKAGDGPPEFRDLRAHVPHHKPRG